MNRSLSTRISSLAVGTVAIAQALALAGCAGQGDIDRSQPDKIPKAMFFAADGTTPKVFYYRQTYIDVPATSGWTFEGMMGNLEKIRFDIQKDYLLGYRAYDYAPGASNPFNGGANNQDTPLVIFKITSQFDVKREYNAGTGEQTNVISENTTDRPWYDRDYLRVDWSQNLADATIDTSSPSALFLPSVRVPVDAYVSQDGTADPDRPIVSSSYLDVTVREIRTPDYDTCINVFNSVMDDADWSGCGPAELKVRHSFMEVPASTYVPLEYPDRELLLGADGQPIRLVNGAFPCSKQAIAQSGGTDCVNASVDQFAKFGFFRTVRQTYDPKYGTTDQGRKYYANRWNIWKDAAAAAKATGPDRTTREIAYYTNPEFPDDPELWDMAKTIIGSWNDAMKQTVASLKLTQPSGTAIIPLSSVETAAATVPDIFVLKQNSCNLQGVKDFAAKYDDLAKLVEDVNGDKLENLTKDHLLQACAALDQATETLAADNPKRFTWQRNGDLRYSFLHWVDRPEAQGPLGYGPASADPETGEIITASAYIYGAALNTYAQTAVETVQLLNHSISIDDILSGKTIDDIVNENTATRKAQQAIPLSAEAKAMATALRDRGTSGAAVNAGRLVQVPPGAIDAKWQGLKGTDIESQLMTTDILNMFAPYSPQLSGQDPDLYARITEMARPANLFGPKAKEARASRLRTLGMNGCVYMADFADDSIIGTAMALAKLPPDELFKQLRASIFRGVSEHEVGHTMGLRHNFAGSTDALNYADDYWQIRTGTPEAEWHNNGISEYQYSTVMDYGAKFNSDVHGLGKYDRAAIRFGYGQLIDAMPTASNTGVALSDGIFFNDYKDIPAMVGGINQMNKAATGVVRYQAIKDATRASFLDPSYKGGVPIMPERPYKFCSDEFVGNLDCKQWDEGANQTEIIDNTVDRFKNYYFFNAFRRDRLSWSIDNYFNRIRDRYFTHYTEAFQFFYFFGSALGGTFLQDDLLRASVDSLNSLGEILETPEPGQHCATSISPDVLVLPSQSGPNSCQNGTGMQVDIGAGKPYFIAFSPDYYWRITRAGSLYEKLAALEALTTTQSRFFRVDTFADANQYSINYYRIFKDQMLNLLSGVIRNDPTVYGGYVSQGQFSPTPVVDLTTYGKVTYDPPPYMLPGTRRVDTPVNKTIRYYALGLTLANLDSSWDSTLDVSNYLNVTIKGAIDDVTYDPSVPIKEFTHPQSGQTFRAATLDSQRTGVGESLIDELNMIAGVQGVTGTLPAKFGYVNSGGDAYPDWQTAKANLDAAQAGTDQNAYQNAVAIFQNVDYLLAYRVDLLSDLRRFRQAFGY